MLKIYQRLAALCLLSLWLFSIVVPVSAQQSGLLPGETLITNPKDRPVTVTAGVPDIVPPSIPILIAPANNSSLTISRPSFVWEESTDNVAVGHYKLFVDGSILFNTIPLNPVDNSQFTLTKSGNRYTLVPKNGIGDGLHTWKIQAVDTSNNTRDSATWSFTIDTTAPVFIITQIGEENVNISAQDPSTVPSEPVEIETNEPQIAGTTEPSSTVQVLMNIQGGGSQTFTTTADGSGNWSITLPLLPRETVITLNFQITDPSGNLTILNDIRFIIKQIFLFPTATPTEQPVPTTSPQVTPGATPSSSPSGSVAPTSTPTSGTPSWPAAGLFTLPSIPILPPKEILNNLVRILFPEGITQFIPDQVEEAVEFIAPVGSALVASTLPITATLALAGQFGWGLSLEMIIRILQALGLLPRAKPQGVVFNSKTGKPVSFALLTIQKIGDLSIKETLVTTVDGIYGGITLSPGKYALEVRHQDYTFPTITARPPYLTMFEYYKGEIFTVKEEKQPQLFMIPVDPLQEQETLAKNLFSRQLLQIRLANFIAKLTVPLFFLTLIILIYVPTVVNWLIFLLYLGIIIFKVIKSLKIPRIKGKVVDTQGKPIPDVFVRILAEQTNQLAALLITDKHGEFKAFVAEDIYQVSLTKNDYIWVEDGKPQTFYQVNTLTSRATIVAVMDNVSNIYKELFG